MADHYMSLNRGEEGFKNVDFTTGTSSASTDKVELRVLDGAGLTRKDVVLILEAFKRKFESDPQFLATAGFSVAL